MLARTPGTKRMRDGYADTVIELARADGRIVFVSVDCGASEREFFRREGGGRLIEVGLAEANSATVSAGLAAEGFKPYVLNFAYLLGRMYNQMSQSISQDGYNVKIAAYYAGIWGIGGRSHNCVTDLAFMRALPNFSIFAPADYWSTKTVVRHIDSLTNPTYLRLSGVTTPVVYESEPPFAPARRLTDGTSCTIFCHGTMVAEALRANRDGALNASVIDLSQIKPLPEQEIVREARRTGGVVVAEEHSLIGGAGEAIAALIARECPMPVRIVAVPDMFPWSILMEEKNAYQYYGISWEDIVKAAHAVSGDSAAKVAGRVSS